MSLVDDAGRPRLDSQAVLDDLADDHFTVELNRFNLEYNSHPQQLSDSGFAALERELAQATARARTSARNLEAAVAVIGILPTLVPDDLDPRSTSRCTSHRGLT
jgi:hypothetical protein